MSGDERDRSASGADGAGAACGEETEAGYAYLDDVAIADVAFRAWGPSLEAAFRESARATTGVMVDDLASVRPLERRAVTLRAQDPEMLLLDYLQELVYYKDAERLFLLPESLSIRAEADGCRLEGTLAGEPVDRARHALGGDVKAVTLHRFRVYREDGGWVAEAVLDV